MQRPFLQTVLRASTPPHPLLYFMTVTKNTHPECTVVSNTDKKDFSKKAVSCSEGEHFNAWEMSLLT